MQRRGRSYYGRMPNRRPGSYRKPLHPVRKNVRFITILILVFTLIVVAALVAFKHYQPQLMAGYQSFSGETRIARVQAVKTGVAHEMNVTLTLYNADQTISAKQHYYVTGDQWMLQGDVIQHLALLGIPSSYKLTSLEGRDANTGNLYPISNDPSTGKLNGGEDGYARFLSGNAWLSLVASVKESDVYMEPGPLPDGRSYDVMVMPGGQMRLKPVN